MDSEGTPTMLKMTSIKKASTEGGNRRALYTAIFTAVVFFLLADQILADDVLLNLPKNFDVTIKRVWHRNKNEGYREYSEKDLKDAEDRVLHFRGKIVTQDIDRTEHRPLSGGEVNIVRLITKLRATYEKGHLSGTWEFHMYTRIQGSKSCNDAETYQLHNKGTITGEANAQGILKITATNIDETSLDRESTTQLVGSGKDARTVTIFGGGWKKSNQERNLYSWGAEYQLPVGELQSSQKFIPDGNKPGRQTQGEETPSSPDTRVSGSDQSSSTQEGPAPVTPGEAAAGAGVVGAIAAVGAWLTMLSSGVRPKDVMDALGGLFGMGQPPEASEPLPITEPPRILFEEPQMDTSTQPTFDKAAYDRMIVDENLKQLQDDVDRAKDALERRQQYIETLRQAGRTDQANREAITLGELQREVSRTQKQLSDSGGQEAGHITKKHIFDIGEDQAAKVKEEMAAEKAGVLSDLERVKLDDWIDLQAPDEQAAKRMRAMVGDRTITLENGKMVGSFEGISRELGQMLQESNQPDLTYVERFSIRDEFMEKAIIFKSARGYGQDAVSTVSTLGKLGVIENADVTGIAKKLNPVAKLSKFVGYMEGYTKGAGNNVGYAVVKSAVQMGVRQVALKNPVIGLGNTVIKYAEKAVLGRDVSPGKALETMVNVAFDAVHDVKDRAPVTFNSATGKFEMGGKILGIDSPELTEPATRRLLSAVDKQLSNPNLGAADRAGLLSDRKDLLETLDELKGQQ